MKITNVAFSKDLHHYVRQNQLMVCLIDLFFPPLEKRYRPTRSRSSSHDGTVPGEFYPSSIAEPAVGCSERNSDPLSRMWVVCFRSFYIRDKSGIGTPFSFCLHSRHTGAEASQSSYNTAWMFETR